MSSLLIVVLTSTGRFFPPPPPSIHVVTHGDCGCGVTAQPSPSDDHVRAEEETAAGRNVQAQRRGEEASRCTRVREARPAPSSAQRGAPHMTFVGTFQGAAVILDFALFSHVASFVTCVPFPTVDQSMLHRVPDTILVGLPGYSVQMCICKNSFFRVN